MPVKKFSVPLTRRQRTVIVFALALGCAVLGVGYAVLVDRGVGIPCLFRVATGLHCPGCGISRALAALLRGNFDAFFEYNLLSPLIVLYLLFVGISATCRYIAHGKFAYRSPCTWVDIGMLTVVLVWWIVRNLLGL